MDAFNDSIFEKKYKNFLIIRKQWLEIIFQHAVYLDQNAQGDAYRPVAILTDKTVLAQAEDILLVWQQFADYAEQKRAAGLSPVSSQMYLPVPELLRNVSSFIVGAFESSNTKNFLREDLLRKIDKKLNILHRAKNKDMLTMIDLEQDKKTIGAYPTGTQFRHRMAGYRDILLDITPMDNCRPNQAEARHRVSAHGIMIDGNSLKEPDAYDINDGSKKATYNSYYDMISPIRCSLFAGSQLYLMSDIKRIKEVRKLTSEANRLKNSNKNKIRARDRDMILAQKEQERITKITEEKRKAQQYRGKIFL